MSRRPLIEISCANPARRRFVLTAAAAATAASWPLILVPGKAKAAEQIVLSQFGGRYFDTLNEAFYKPFTQETGIPVVIAPPPELAKIEAMVRTGNSDYDMVDPLIDWIVQGDREGLWEPIDTKIVDRTDVVPSANRVNQQGYYLSGGGIIYSEERHAQPESRPKSWPEFWDVARFPGRRCLFGQALRTLEIALMADGVEAKAIYPLDVERAFKALDRIKPNIKLWTNPSQTISVIEQNEADFSYSFNGRVFASRMAGNNIGFVNNQCVVVMGYLAVIKGARNKEAAMKLINYSMRPERQGAWANIYGYWGTNKRCEAYIKPEVKASLLDFSEPSHCWANLEYWGDHNAELSKRFKEWTLT
jgi:putative spermidine/putrescine transport system substrate-binding protein